MQFTVDTNTYTLSREEIARSGFLTELVFHATNTDVVITADNATDFRIVYAYLREGKVPFVSEYPAIEYFRIPAEDSYALACVLEDDMRQHMYAVGADEKYFDQGYGLQIIDAAFWASFTPKRLVLPPDSTASLMFEGPVPQKADWSEIEARLAELAPFFREEGCFIAGGAIFAILFGLPLADIDLFYYGINEEEATRRVNDFDACERSRVVRTKNAITYYNDLSCHTPEVQIILRLYKTRSEIISGFDVCSCCLGYDGKHIYVTNRGMYALTHLVNTVSFTRLSPSYERRLAKYAARGIAVYVPDFDRSKVNLDALDADFYTHRPQLGDNTTEKYRHLTGKAPLDTLLYLERHLETYAYAKRPANMVKNFSNEICDYTPKKSGEPRGVWNGTNLAWLLDYLIECEPSKKCIYNEKIRAYKPLLKALKETGEKWDYRITLTNIPCSKSVYFLRCRRSHLPRITNFDPRVYEILSIVRPFDFPAKLAWKTTLPGEQMTNTFHSIVLQDRSVWYNGCYYNSISDSKYAKGVSVPVTTYELPGPEDFPAVVDITPELTALLQSRSVREYDVLYLCHGNNYPRAAYVYVGGRLQETSTVPLQDYLSPTIRADYWTKVLNSYEIPTEALGDGKGLMLCMTNEYFAKEKHDYFSVEAGVSHVFSFCFEGGKLRAIYEGNNESDLGWSDSEDSYSSFEPSSDSDGRWPAYTVEDYSEEDGTLSYDSDAYTLAVPLPRTGDTD